jgi:HrpA-like RNA helicase
MARSIGREQPLSYAPFMAPDEAPAQTVLPQTAFVREQPAAGTPVTPPESTVATAPQTTERLPIDAYEAEIVEALKTNSAVIIVSPTGTGKSTRLPQIALRAGFDKIIETQPRRKAAANIYQRIREELAIDRGEAEAACLVACQTGDGRIGMPDAPIQVVTDGTLKRLDAEKLPGSGNELWIIDEQHEENKNMWSLLRLGTERCLNDPNFTLVITTATADKYKLINYLTDENGQEPAVIELEAQMYDIGDREEPKSTTVKEVLKAAKDIYENPDAHGGSNTIVLFERGKREIKDTLDELRAKLPSEILARTRLLGGHSRMIPEALAPIYEPVDGIKIVVQTNMGKTSMTIPGVRYVITGGKERQIEIDDEDDQALVDYNSTQDCMMQMRGRAGRTNTGIFIHTRYEGEPFVPMHDRAPHLTPEILRSSIDGEVLYWAYRGDNVLDFDGIDAIPLDRKQRALRRVRALGALDDHNQITALGKRMMRYPLSPNRARSMVEAEQYGARIRLYMAAITACAESGGLRLFEKDGTTRWEQLSEETSSDSLQQLDIFLAVKDMPLYDMRRYDIDTNNFHKAAGEFRKIAYRSGLSNIPADLAPPNQEERDILRHCIAAGLINQIYIPEGEGFFKKLGVSLKLREISNRSVVSQYTGSILVGEPRNVVIYKQGEEERKPIIEDVTEISKDILGKLAVHMSEWVTTGYKQRGGRFVETQERMLGPVLLDRREWPAKASPQLRAQVLERVKVRPGKSLRYLYGIKKELEHLAHRSKHPIPRLTQDMIDGYVAAVTPESVDSPGHVEENLRQLIVYEGISLGKFLSPKERARIIKNSPDTMRVGDLELRLHYQNRKAFVRRFKPGMIALLDDSSRLELPDGREIYFAYGEHGHKYTLQQLKKKLRDEGWI